MPIGSNAVVAPPPAPNLLDDLFEPANRDYLLLLIELANLSSGVQMWNPGVPAYLGAWPAVPLGGGLPPLAPAPAAAVTDRVTLLQSAERTAMLQQWWQIWSPPMGGPPGVASDQNLLAMIRNYIANPVAPVPGGGGGPVAINNPYVMWLPRVAYDGILGNKMKFRLLDYQQVPLAPAAGGGGWAWNQPNVESFLDLLSLGAHFVVIHAAADLATAGYPGVPASFYTTFANLLGGASAWARAHSHYSGAGGLTNLGAAYTYPATVNAETAPIPCPYIAAFLVGRTAWSLFNNPYNTFFQLEGWPATGVTGFGGRHGQDFATHQATLWNISTFGTSIYSEKRGTTVFLAPPGWNPQPQAGTIMMPYVGAETPQGWLDTKLVRV